MIGSGGAGPDQDKFMDKNMNKPNKPVVDSIPRRKFLALSSMVPAMAVAQSMGGEVFAAAAPGAVRQ